MLPTQTVPSKISAIEKSLTELATAVRSLTSMLGIHQAQPAPGLTIAGQPSPAVKRHKKKHRAKGATLTRWVADAKAKRVPTFVIEMTKLDTKKAIVDRFGAGTVFEQGKPMPTALTGRVETAKGKKAA